MVWGFYAAFQYLLGHAKFVGSELDGAVQAIVGLVGIALKSALFSILSAVAVGLTPVANRKLRALKKA